MSEDLISEVNDFSNELAARLKGLIDKAADGVHVAAEELRPVVTALSDLCSDRTRPVPPVPETPADQPV